MRRTALALCLLLVSFLLTLSCRSTAPTKASADEVAGDGAATHAVMLTASEALERERVVDDLRESIVRRLELLGAGHISCRASAPERLTCRFRPGEDWERRRAREVLNRRGAIRFHRWNWRENVSIYRSSLKEALPDIQLVVAQGSAGLLKRVAGEAAEAVLTEVAEELESDAADADASEAEASQAAGSGGAMRLEPVRTTRITFGHRERGTLRAFFQGRCRPTQSSKYGFEARYSGRGGARLDRERSFWTTYCVSSQPVVSGAAIADVQLKRHERYGVDYLLLEMTDDGREQLGAATAASKGQHLAVAIDDVVVAAPRVDEVITGGKMHLTLGGNTPRDDRRERLRLFRTFVLSGALPTEIERVEFKGGPGRSDAR